MRILFLLVCLTVMSCNQQKKTQRYLFEHPEFSSGYCAEQYPMKDSSFTKTDTLIKYDTVIDLDSWLNDTVRYVINKDTIEKIVYKTRTITVVKVIKDTTVIYRENTALVAKLRNDLDQCNKMNFVLVNKSQDQEKSIAYWKGKARTRFWWILLLIGGGITYTVMKFKKSFFA